MCPLKISTTQSGSYLLALISCMLLIISLTGSRTRGQITGVAAEGSSTIGKSRFMISGNYSSILPPGIFWEDHMINQPGLKVGVGISKFVDFKFYFSRWAVRGSDYHRNVFQLISKVTGAHQMVALYIPFGFIYSRYKMDYGEDDIGKLWMVSPRLIGTLVRKDHFDMCLVPYVEILHEKSDSPVVTGGMNIGFGLYTLSKRLSLRLEGGVDIRTLIAGYPCGNVGLGLNYIFGKDE